MNTKPSAGPWRVGFGHEDTFDDTIPIISGQKPAEIVVACCWPIEAECGSDSPEALANARLISASPDLLHACIEAFEWLQDGTPDDDISPAEQSVRNILESAIAKATGGAS